MNQLNNAIDHAEKYCQEKGIRLTKKRKIILTALLQTEKAISAYELVEYCETQLNEVIPAMSVYRILDFLQDQGLAHRLDSANKYVACSHISCSHEHEVPQFLICGGCQKVEEISISQATIKVLEKSVTTAGYHLVSPQLEMNCLCQQCASSAA